jgi:hypothetical protein
LVALVAEIHCPPPVTAQGLDVSEIEPIRRVGQELLRKRRRQALRME